MSRWAPSARSASRARRSSSSRRPTSTGGRPMSSPTERPVPADSAPDQSAADMAATTPAPNSTESDMLRDAYGVERKGMFGVQDAGDTSGFGGLVREPWSPPTAERPYGSYFDEIVDALYEAYPQAGEAIRKVV